MSLEDDAARFNPDAYAIACARMKSAPLELTDHDFDQLAIVSSRLETDAYTGRRLAQLATSRRTRCRRRPRQR